MYTILLHIMPPLFIPLAILIFLQSSSLPTSSKNCGWKAGTRGAIQTRRHSGNTNETSPAKSESSPAAAGDGRRRKLTTTNFRHEITRDTLLIYLWLLAVRVVKNFVISICWKSQLSVRSIWNAKRSNEKIVS